MGLVRFGRQILIRTQGTLDIPTSMECGFAPHISVTVLVRSVVMCPPEACMQVIALAINMSDDNGDSAQVK